MCVYIYIYIYTYIHTYILEAKGHGRAGSSGQARGAAPDELNRRVARAPPAGALQEAVT